MNPNQLLGLLQLLADLRLQLGEVTAELEKVKAERDMVAADLRTAMDSAVTAEPATTNGEH